MPNLRRLDVTDLPYISQSASEHFTYADLCHCSEIWRATQVENVPREAETYGAMAQLCELVLEPVLRKFTKWSSHMGAQDRK